MVVTDSIRREFSRNDWRRSGPLSLPFATVSRGSMSLVDAIFQSTSAVCITGLTTLSVATDLTLYGQIVILVLFQAGALGIMTYSLALVSFVQQRGSPERNEWLANIFTHDRKLPPRRMLAWIVRLTIAMEVVGVIALFPVFFADYGWIKALYFSVFHSVSGFCNAGFSLFQTSLIGYQSSVPMNVIMSVLIISGAIGFVVTFEVWRWATGKRRWFKLLVQTKLVLATYAVLLLIGIITLFVFELGGQNRDMPFGTQLLTAFFQSTLSRTSGFCTVDMSTLTYPSLLFIIVYMFIGGAPGSTAGGIKVTTAAVLVLAFVSRYRSNPKTEIFNRSVPFDTIIRAMILTTVAALIVIIGTFLLQITELWGMPHREASGHFFDLLFEATSAFGTVGLSTGVTPTLTSAGRVVVLVLMFIGRVGPLTLAALLLGKQTTSRLSYVEEDVMIG